MAAFAHPGVLHRAARPVRVAITGAASYSGRYMSELLASDPNVVEVRSMTNHPNRKWSVENAKPQNMTTVPLQFDDGAVLRESLRGIDVLICTYWTRFSEDEAAHAGAQGADAPPHPAVTHVKALTDAAVAAGVQRMIYVSHTKPGLDPAIPQYIRGKAECEAYIESAARRAGAGFTCGFVRPCCIFGDTPNESIVVNNTAYLARRLPVLLLAGNGRNVFQPVHVRDLAEMCVSLALWPGGLPETANEGYPTPPRFLDAVGPEKLSITEFMRVVRDAVYDAERAKGGVLARLRPRPVLLASHLPAGWIFPLVAPLNYLLDDVFVEQGDLQILTDNLAGSARTPAAVRGDLARLFPAGGGAAVLPRYPTPPAPVGDYNLWGRRPFTAWVQANAAELGTRYLNSYARYYDCSGMRDFKRRVAQKRIGGGAKSA